MKHWTKRCGAKILLFLMGMSVIIAASGCGSGGGKAPEDPQAVAQAVLDSVAFRDSLIKAEGAVAENYYKLDDTVKEHAIYVSGSGATAEEIAVLKVSDQKDVEAAKAILEKRVDELKFRFESYVPAEMVKLEKPVIITQDDLAILVLADDPDQAEEAVKGTFE